MRYVYASVPISDQYAGIIGTVLVPSDGHFQCKNINLSLKYTEAILSNNTRNLLWFEITEMLIAVLENKSTVLFTTIFGTLSFPVWYS